MTSPLDLLAQTSPPRPFDTLDESLLTPPDAPSPFLPGTNIQYAWDSTCLGLFKTCPRLYQYTMINGWATTAESVHLRFGIEYHAALEHFDRCLAEGQARPDALRSTVQLAWGRTDGWAPDTTVKPGKYKNRETLLQLLIDYIDHFDPDPAETYIKTDGTPAVELSFRFELEFGPTSGQVLPTTYTGMEVDMSNGELKQTIVEEIHHHPNQPYILCGHLDRVANFNGSLFVLDRKTTTTTLGPYYFGQYEPNNQMTLYTLAGSIMLNAPVKGVIIDAAQIKLDDPNAFARGFTYRTEAQLQEWLQDLETTLSLAETYALNSYWPMNDTACDKFGGCRFREICRKDPHVRQAFLKSNYHKLKDHERWNPLQSR